jgi:DNA-binding PadR family transcriptional regulator
MTDDGTAAPPLTPVALHVLVALAGGAAHGYAVAQEVERATEGAVKLGPGTLYGSLQRLQHGGLIEEVDPPADADGAHADRRRYFELTALGERTLREDARRLARVVRTVKKRLGDAPAR